MTDHLHDVWALAARTCPPELCAAWGLSGVIDPSSPSVEQRRLFPMALAMTSAREELAVLAEHDPDAGVRAAACQHLARLAGPEDVVLSRLAKEDASDDVRAAAERAVIEATLATSESSAAFLNRMRSEPVHRVQYALTLLREKQVVLDWADVSNRIEHRSFPVLLELARLFMDRPTAAPVRSGFAVRRT